MSLFKKKLSLEDIVNALNELSPEDRQKLIENINEPIQSKTEEVVEQQENVEESNTQPEEEKAELNSTNEEVDNNETTNEEKADDVVNNTEETTKIDEKVSEEVVEQTPQEVKSQEELQEAQNLKFTEMEEKIAKLEAMITTLTSKEDSGDFGLNPRAPESTPEENKHSSAVMRGYAGRDAYKYQ